MKLTAAELALVAAMLRDGHAPPALLPGTAADPAPGPAVLLAARRARLGR